MARPKITQEELSELLNLALVDYTRDLFIYFSVNPETETPDLNPETEISVTKSFIDKGIGAKCVLYPVLPKDGALVTTVGRILVNNFLFGANPETYKQIGFINEPFTKDVIGGFDNKMATLLKEDKITQEEYIDYLDRIQWLGFGMSSLMAPSLNFDIIRPVPEVRELKKELIEKNKGKLDSIDTIGKMEKELLSLADKKLRENKVPGLIIYDSGNGSFSNNYKNSSVMAGMLPKSNNLGKMDFVEDCLADGISIKNIHKSADKMVIASFSRAVGTQDGGYLTKIYNASFSHVVIDEDAQSDCGTTYTMNITLDKKSMSEYHLRYVIDEDGIEQQLTEDFIKANMGKTFKLRSQMFCKSEKLCSRCAGGLYYTMGIYSIGNAFSKMSSRIMNLA